LSFWQYWPPMPIYADVDATCVIFLFFIIFNIFFIIYYFYFLIIKNKKNTHVASTSTLTWSKFVWGAKTIKGTILSGWIVFYFARGPKSQLPNTLGAKTIIKTINKHKYKLLKVYFSSHLNIETSSITHWIHPSRKSTQLYTLIDLAYRFAIIRLILHLQ